uniref:U16-Eretoxin-Ek1g_1 n=1 Tax=Eresus cinnaberinus TaxID=175337 RepID=A0A2D0PBV7_ERECI
MELKAQVMILLVVCIAVAASENYCPEVKGECSLVLQNKRLLFPKTIAHHMQCAAKAVVATYVKIHQLPDKGVAIKPGDECKIGP